MPRVKVLHSLCRVGSGGVEQRRLLLAEHLPSERFEHLLICQDLSGGLPSRFLKFGWRLAPIGKPRHILDPIWHWKAIKLARSFGPDLIHGAVFEGEALACSIGIANRRVPVIMEETSDPVKRRSTGNALMSAMLLRANRAVAVSPAVERYLVEKLGVPEQKIRVIDNAVAKLPAPSQERLDELRVWLGISSKEAPSEGFFVEPR